MITIDGKQIKLQIWDTVRLKLSVMHLICVELENDFTFLISVWLLRLASP